jgi:ATP-dependent Clp protease ATP-binding subunit ClpB
MDLNQYTHKAQQAILAAQSLAEEQRHSQIEPQHLLLALLRQSDGVVPQVIGKLGSNLAILAAAIERELRDKPQLHGATDQVGLSRDLAELFKHAEKTARDMRDDFVSTEHLLLTLTDGRSPLSNFLASHGVTHDAILQALAQVRGSQRVTSQHPESTYAALEKYGRDLTQLGRTGKRSAA